MCNTSRNIKFNIAYSKSYCGYAVYVKKLNGVWRCCILNPNNHLYSLRFASVSAAIEYAEITIKEIINDTKEVHHVE